jgi:hypothetical protein
VVGLTGNGNGLSEKAVKSDAEGRFTFSDLPPGRYSVGRIFRPPGPRDCTNIGIKTHVRQALVKSGQTTKITLGGGMKLTGRFCMPDTWPPTHIVGDSILEPTKKPSIPKHPPTLKNAESMPKWYEKKSLEVEFLEDCSASVSHLCFGAKEDGTFCITDVPPGNYMLRIDFYDQKQTEYTTASKEVTVPNGDPLQTIDVGEIPVHFGTTALQTRTKAPPLSLPTLKGDPFHSSQQKGKWMLLHFWTLRCASSVEEMRALTQWAETDPNAPVMLGINVDGDCERALACVEEEGVSWPQAVLAKEQQSLPEQLYWAHCLPATCMVCPDGTIGAYRLRGCHLVEDCMKAMDAWSRDYPASDKDPPEGAFEVIQLPIDTSLGTLLSFNPGALEHGLPDDFAGYESVIGEAQGEIEVPVDGEVVLVPYPSAMYDPDNGDVRKLLSHVTQLRLSGIRNHHASHAPQEAMTLAPHIPGLRAISTDLLNPELVSLLNDLPNVKNLEIVEHVSKKGLEHLGDLKNIETLHLGNWPRDLSPLDAMPKLKTLSFSVRLGRNDIRALDSFTRRDAVQLWLNAEETSYLRDVEYLSGLKSLQRLRFHFERFTCPRFDCAKVFGLLAQLPSLEELNCGCSGILTTESLDTLSTMKHLKVLNMPNVDGCNDETLQYLAPLSSLEFLYLRSDTFTDACIPAIENLPSLKTLVLWPAPKFSPEGLERLRKRITVREN